jgi:hypothetical protein
MKSNNSKQLLEEIDTTLQNIKSLQGLPCFASNYFAKFLIVYICGIYEEIVEGIIVEMADKNSSPELKSFVKITMDNFFRNPNSKKIAEVIKKFGNEKWIDEFKGISQSSKTALDSIVENKNSLAHGQPSFTLTISDVENYYHSSKYIFEKIDDLML